MTATPEPVEHHRVVVVGAGIAGLGAVITLRERGIDDVVVLERAGEIGGTWRDNTYPGCACDVPSNLYSYSFAQNPDWTRFFPRQPEILDYLRRTADRFAARDAIRLDTDVTSAAWDDVAARWRVGTSRGTLTADVLVVAAGALSEPAVPDVPGLDAFRGAAFHSARWRHDIDLAGKRVAVVGTGASAVQIVPEVAKVAGQVYVVQRTPAWIRPRADRKLSGRHTAVFRRLPMLQTVVRITLYWLLELLGVGFTIDQRLLTPLEADARRHLRKQVADPALRKQLTPSFRIGCKRILYSNDFYPTLQRDNVELVPSGLRALTANGIVTADGRTREVDAVVLATGFAATRPPLAGRITGRDGRTLHETWADGMRAYLGTSVAGFPNCFFVIGPNTGLGHTSMILMIESQLRYIGDCLRLMAERDIDVVEVRADAERRYAAAVQRRLARTVWASGGCASWYLDEHGRNTTLWPASTWRFRLRTRRFDPTVYALRRVRSSAGSPGEAGARAQVDPVPAGGGR